MTDRILEIGTAGLESADQKVRKLMDNMVGSEVPGFKKSDVMIRGFPLELEAATQRLSSVKPQVEGTFYNTIQGALIKTDSQLDLALGSSGFFVVMGDWGEGYTRDGRFQLDKEGRLLSVSGNFPVMGQAGPIIVPPGSSVEFTQEGEIKVDGVTVDTILVVNPENPEAFESLNGSIFKLRDPYAVLNEVVRPRVIQGYVEASNVNIIDQMMEMIYLERIYTLNTKIIQTRDTELSRAMEMGSTK
ncbi:MAG: flagellar hook basal-body protein [Candidatus Saganbacteria bacterium]|nr:flagellar hook basal-body protein [Candidatus Saganbacteria bacterium]